MQAPERPKKRTRSVMTGAFAVVALALWFSRVLDRMAFVGVQAARLRGNVGCAMGAQSHRFGTVAQTH